MILLTAWSVFDRGLGKVPNLVAISVLKGFLFKKNVLVGVHPNTVLDSVSGCEWDSYIDD